MLQSKNALRFALVCIGLLPLACSASVDDNEEAALSSESSALKSFPSLPSPTLAVPDGNRLAFFHDAVGVQIYACQAAAGGYAWTFTAPEASLLDCRGNVVVSHYAGPTWESVADHSKVVAAKVAGFTDDPSAIAELLLQASSHEGEGRMADVTYIQRLDTTGGLAPSAGCDAEHVGDVARVDYTATYYFYRASSHRN
jgi:hypothetical protein